MSARNAGIGQIVVSADPAETITALGLGSCIGLAFIDERARVAGMAHVMLPASRAADADPPGKFADTAVPALLAAVLAAGADCGRLVVKMAGGASMFAGAGQSAVGIGERNAQAVRAALKRAGLRLHGADVGGSAGRTLSVAVGTGAVAVRTVGGASAPI